MTTEEALAAFKRGADRFAPPGTVIREVEAPFAQDFALELAVFMSYKVPFTKRVVFERSSFLGGNPEFEAHYLTIAGEVAGVEAQKAFLWDAAGYGSEEEMWQAGMQCDVRETPDHGRIIVRKDFQIKILKYEFDHAPLGTDPANVTFCGIKR